MNLTDVVERPQLKTDLPRFGPGDTVKVHVRVSEGTRERIQNFQGVVIRRRGGGLRETFTVRKISFGIGVERTFPLHSPNVAKVEVVTRGDVRRAKLYYLRDRVGRAARIKEKREPRGSTKAVRAAAAAEAAKSPPPAAEPPPVEQAPETAATAPETTE